MPGLLPTDSVPLSVALPLLVLSAETRPLSLRLHPSAITQPLVNGESAPDAAEAKRLRKEQHRL